MIVRRASEPDIPEIVRLKAQLMATGWPWPVDVADDEQWRERCAFAAATLLASATWAAFVVPRDDPHPGAPLVAMVSVAVEQHLPGPSGRGMTAYVGDMSTDPDHRGQGLGTRLLDEALSWAREQGAGRVELHATQMGRGIYERAGFQEGGLFAHLSLSLD